jgi:hypothetical protein
MTEILRPQPSLVVVSRFVPSAQSELLTLLLIKTMIVCNVMSPDANSFCFPSAIIVCNIMSNENSFCFPFE